MTNIFAIGNVLDPHVRIEGKCRACLGGGREPDLTRCNVCGGTGQASALVRLSTLTAPVYGAEWLGTAEQLGAES